MDLGLVVYLGAFLAILVLSITSFIIADVTFIKLYPMDFILEILFVGLIPALLMAFIFAKTRKMNNKDILYWFLTLSIKLIIFHILFQLSGLYTHAFGVRA